MSDPNAHAIHVKIVDHDIVNPEDECTYEGWKRATLGMRPFHRVPCEGEEITLDGVSGVVRHVQWIERATGRPFMAPVVQLEVEDRWESEGE